MEELKKMRIWACWNYVRKNEKTEKRPISASGGQTGSDKGHANSWVTYEEAKAAAEKRNYDGVLFVVPKGYCFLDIDHRDATDPLVRRVVQRFSSYTEYSVSGDGIHIYGRCDSSRIPTYADKNGKRHLDSSYYTKNPQNGMELYVGGIANRFAVYTGKALRDVPLNECTQAVLTTLNKEMRRKQKSEMEDDGALARFDIVSALRKQKNGDKFSRLYDRGDFSEYRSQSEADAALCAMIAFRTGPDAAAIDEIFRESALYREKWERDDYRENTIALGIKGCNGTFYQSGKSNPDFIRIRGKTKEPYVVVPLLAQYVREHLKYVLVRDSGKQGILKYVYEEGVYRFYADNMFLGVIKAFIAEYNEELVRMNTLNETLQLLTTDLKYVSQDDLNADESMINFKNGLLRMTDTETTLLPHTPDVLSTIQIPCEWTGVPTATPVFDSYMRTLTDGNTGVERLLLEFIGACISNIKGWRMKKALFLTGDGDTGKSQLKNLVERLLGKGNFIGIDLKEIEARFGTGAIYGTRLAGSSDMSFMTVEELKTFKKITGGDSLYAEFKGQQAFEFTYNGLLWFCMNRLPKFGGDDGKWVYDRIMVVECPNVIPQEKQDKEILDKMYAERDGIVYKAIRALQTVIANGYRFSEPQCVISARAVYMESNNTVISFYHECMCPWPDDKINLHCTTGRIFKVYRAWCGENNNGYAKTKKEFRDDLSAFLGIPYADLTTRRNGNTYFIDYTLTPETKTQFAQEYGCDAYGQP